MDERMRYQIFTGPMDEDWLVAELYYGEEMWGEITDWGEKITLYPRQDGQPWRFSTKEMIAIIMQAQERVRSSN